MTKHTIPRAFLSVTWGKEPPLRLAGAGTGPSDSFTTVVESHWTAVYRLLYSLTGNLHDTEDLTQETFLRALHRWDSFQQGTNLRAWLLRIGTNAFLDVKRKKKTLQIGPLSDEVAGHDKSAEDMLEERERSELILAAMDDLSELKRMVFHLRVIEELSFKEIGLLADITEVTARQYMYQARLKLLRTCGDSPSSPVI